MRLCCLNFEGSVRATVLKTAICTQGVAKVLGVFAAWAPRRAYSLKPGTVYILDLRQWLHDVHGLVV